MVGAFANSSQRALSATLTKLSCYLELKTNMEAPTRV
jgi:hypothetical protein